MNDFTLYSYFPLSLFLWHVFWHAIFRRTTTSDPYNWDLPMSHTQIVNYPHSFNIPLVKTNFFQRTDTMWKKNSLQDVYPFATILTSSNLWLTFIFHPFLSKFHFFPFLTTLESSILSGFRAWYSMNINIFSNLVTPQLQKIVIKNFLFTLTVFICQGIIFHYTKIR